MPRKSVFLHATDSIFKQLSFLTSLRLRGEIASIVRAGEARFNKAGLGERPPHPKPADWRRRNPPLLFVASSGYASFVHPHTLSSLLEFIVRICFDPSTLHQSRSGSITGVIYFEFDQKRQFPSLGWNDFVVVLGAWWMAALREITEGASEVKLRFMDGPYWITVASHEGEAMLRCTEDRRGAGVVYETNVKLIDLTAEIFSYACKVSDACKAAGISSSDLGNMRTGLPN